MLVVVGWGKEIWEEECLGKGGFYMLSGTFFAVSTGTDFEVEGAVDSVVF